MSTLRDARWNIPLAEKLLGPDLWAASKENNILEVRELALKLPYPSADVWTAVLLPATEGGAVDVATHCLEQGAEVADSLLWTVVGSEGSDAVYRYLVESRALSVNYEIDRTGSLLGLLAARRRHSLARFLLEHGADPNQQVQCKGHITVLAVAALCVQSNPEMIDLLLEHGASLKGSGALVLAAERGRLESVRMLLERGADVDEMGVVKPDERSLAKLGTPLHKAVENAHVGVIGELLNAGADVSLLDAKGRTALDIAKAVGLEDVVLAKLASKE